MRDIVFCVVILALLPVCFRRPLIGLLAFSWLAYMRTQDLCWYWAQNQRWSFLIAVVTAAGYLSRGHTRWFVADMRNYVMIALGAWVGLSMLFSDMFDPSLLDDYIEFCKVLGVALFTTAVVNKREHLRVLMWVIALSFGFYGIKVGLSGVLTFGRLRVLQGPGGMLEDNNNFGLALTMALPLLIQIGFAEKNRILRRGVFVIIPLTVITILLTHSRGAFLSLAAMTLVMVWRSRNRFAGFAVVAIAALVGVWFVPAEYIDRIRSIAEYQQDGSAMGRLAAWQTAINMAKANPIFGVGFQTFQWHYSRYASGAEHEGRRVAHNAYLQVLSECGAPALGLYLFLIGASMWSLWRVRKQAELLYYSSWIINYAKMLEASMVAFIVGSTFLNRAQFDLYYHFVAIIVAFEVIALREMAGLPSLAGGRQLGGELSVVRPRGFGPAPRRNGFDRQPAPGGFA
jgi:probable O-glycosylation ligase (exosortase A-associated)